MEFEVDFRCSYWGLFCAACYKDWGDCYTIHLSRLKRFTDKRGVDYAAALGEIAAHELTHSLGVDHSREYWRALRKGNYEDAVKLDKWPF